MKTFLKNVAIVVLAIVCFSCEQETIETTLQENAKPQTEGKVVNKATRVTDLTSSINTRESLFLDRIICGTNVRIKRGVKITIGDFLYTLRAEDGNFVCYNLKKGPGDPDSHPVWATGTENKGVEYIYIQEDGNVVAYTKDFKKVWESDLYSMYDCSPRVTNGWYGFINGDLITNPSRIPGSWSAKRSMPVKYPQNY